MTYAVKRSTFNSTHLYRYTTTDAAAAAAADDDDDVVSKFQSLKHKMAQLIATLINKVTLRRAWLVL